MRPVEFTSEDIIRAGQELQAAGRNITGFALRQKVGGGNPNRLKQVWDEYLASQIEAHAEPVAELPVEVAEEVASVAKTLTDRIAALAVGLNDKAVKAAERRVAEIVRAAGEQKEQAERELADASQTVDDLEEQLDGLRSELEAAQIRLSGMTNENQALAVELAQIRERLSANEQSAKVAAEQYAAELDKMNNALEVAQTRGGQAAEQLAVLKAQMLAEKETHQEQRKASSKEITRQAELYTKAHTERDEALKEAATLRGRIQALEAMMAVKS